MKTFSGRVAVVTGAASGIGLAMAQRFAKEGMKVVLADVEAPALEAAAQSMKESGADVLAVRVDVSKADEVETLAGKAYAFYGGVHIVCNNAGVASRTVASWEQSLEDWEWVINVNLWGVVHGIRSFVPRMLTSGDEGHIVNTASVAGLVSSPYLAPYHVSKHSVVTLSECLYYELMAAQAKLHVSVLCPAWVNTKIVDSGRNRPHGAETLGGDSDPVAEGIRKLVADGLPPEAVADRVFEAVHDEKLYILTHPEWKEGLRARVDAILNDRNPAPPTRIA
jgi:NAD(P)-dependent dehydrogenase (short-subunit alcohol dehydrogenase family)